MEIPITLGSADDDVPLEPKLLRELRDALRESDDLDLGLKLKDRPPAPGEQGALPVALEVLGLSIPLAGSFAKVLCQWMISRQVTLKVTRADGRSIEVTASDTKRPEKLVPLVMALLAEDDAPAGRPASEAEAEEQEGG
jgi:hypothetical protein